MIFTRFFMAMKPLREAGKLACVLIQLPGFLRFDPDRLESFLSLLPDDQSFAVEFCPIWSRAVPEKRFCPHVARVFLMVDPERARSLLSLIQSGLGNWKFESKLAVEFPV